MDRKQFLHEQECKLIAELDGLVDEPESRKFLYKKQRLDGICAELQQLRAAELTMQIKEKEHAMAMQMKDKEIQLKEKEIELKRIESETAIKIKELDTEVALADSSSAGCVRFGKVFVEKQFIFC
jgi:hypothetical protein